MRHFLAIVTSIVASMLSVTAPAQEPVVRIGHGVPTLSFLPLLAARALDSFKDQGLRVEFAVNHGGDRAVLTALNSGDIDFAAIEANTALDEIVRGQPFQIIYSLMSQVTLELVMSRRFLKRVAVSPADLLPRRISALKQATICVSAIGSTSERAARWLVGQGHFDRQDEVEFFLAGPPPAIQVALDHGEIDGYVLSPPEGELSEQRGTGEILIRLGTEFPDLHALPYIVLVTKMPLSGKLHDLAVMTARALQSASQKTLEDSAGVARKIQEKFYPNLKPDLILAGINSMRDGIADSGRMSQAQIEHLLEFLNAKGALSSDSGSNAFWTNDIVTAALQARRP